MHLPAELQRLVILLPMSFYSQFTGQCIGEGRINERRNTSASSMLPISHDERSHSAAGRAHGEPCAQNQRARTNFFLRWNDESPRKPPLDQAAIGRLNSAG